MHRTLGNQDRHARAHGVVVLGGDVEDGGANEVCHAPEDSLQPLRVVRLVEVGQILLAVRPALGVADVVDVEAQALGQVVEPAEPEFLSAYSHVSPPSRSRIPILCSATFTVIISLPPVSELSDP